MNKTDITNLKHTINTASTQINSINDKVAINTIVENLITDLLGSEFASLWIFDKHTASLHRYRDDNSTNTISMLGQHGVLAKCFFTLSSGIYNYIASEKEYTQEVDNPDNIRMKSKIILPIMESDNFLGMVTAYSSVYKIRNFTNTDLEVLQALEPFLKQAIYKIAPNLKSENVSDDIYISKKLLETSSNIAKKVEQIQQNEKEQQVSSENTVKNDETINFLATTVHDIRTPANTLYGFLELLEDQLTDKRLLGYIHNAKESASFINELTTSILDKISSQQEVEQLKPDIINPTKFFADIAQSFSSNMYNKNITFNVYIDPYLPKEIEIESVLLKRVIMNLLNNAYKFTPNNKSIDLHIAYKEDEHKLKVIVSDTGIGIAKDKQKEIFEAFKQADSNTKSQYGGTGLGLAITSEYVTKLGGAIKLKSELDVGSSFYFNIPIKVINAQKMYHKVTKSHIKLGMVYDKKNLLSARNILKYFIKDGLPKESITPLKTAQNVTTDLTHIICFQNLLTKELINFTKSNNIPLLVVEEKFLSLIDSTQDDFIVISKYEYYADKLFEFISSNTPIKVLIADDDKINISLIEAILETEFCTIDTATDGQQAFEMLNSALANENPYDIVYLDKNMPHLEGYEVLQKYRELEKILHKHIFAVSISGDINDNKVGTLFDMQVSKPFNKTAIKESIKKIKQI
jgi:signal transduction histidine kinase